MRLRIIVKQYITLLTIGLLFLFCFIFYSYQLYKIDHIYSSRAVNAIEQVKLSSSLNSAAQFIRYYDEVLTQSARNYAFTGDVKWKQRYDENVPKLDEKIQYAIKNDPEEEIFNQVNAANLALINMEEASAALVAEGNKAGAIAILESPEYSQQKKIYSDALVQYAEKKGNQYDEIAAASTSSFNDISNAIKQAFRQSIYFTVGIIFLVICILTLIGILITKVITRPLEQLKLATNEISKGNLCPVIDIKNNDEVGDLASAFCNMAAALKESRSSVNRKVDEQTKVIKEAQVKDEAYLTSIGDGVFAVDNDEKIILVNPQTEELLGIKEQELIGKSLTDSIKMLDKDKKQIPHDQRPILKVLRNGKKEYYNDLYFVRKDRSEIPIALTTAPIILNGEIIGAIDVFRDITKEKQIDQAKTEFVSLASHQLRTPLSAVNWYAEMLIAGDVGKLTKEQKKYVEEIYHGNQRMVDLVNALLDVSRIELGTFAVEPKKTDLEEIAKSLLDELKSEITRKKQIVIEKYDKALPELMVDPKLLRIVIQNLLSNAVKYTPEKGKITIELAKHEPDAMIRVQDTGYGIPKNQQEQIFQKLFRADNVRQKDTEGTGLGLYIVKSIVEQSGGKIWFESKENKGSTFYVTIPLKGMPKKTGTKVLEDIK